MKYSLKNILLRLLRGFFSAIKNLWRRRTKKGRELYLFFKKHAEREYDLIREWEIVTDQEYNISEFRQQEMSEDFIVHKMTDFEITCKYAPIEYLRKTFGYGHPVVTKRIQEMEKQRAL